MNRFHAIGVIVVLGTVAGCDPAAYTERATNDDYTPPATSGGEQAQADGDEDEAPITDQQRADGEHVRVLTSVPDGTATEVVGLVDVHEPPGQEQNGIADLRARAAMRGAEALTHVQVHAPAPGENITHFAGMAIRFNDLLQGRHYVTLGDIDVDGSMMHEDDAYAELQRRAAAMHADLILGVSFDHGDGTRPLHVRGTAIQFRPSV